MKKVLIASISAMYSICICSCTIATVQPYDPNNPNNNVNTPNSQDFQTTSIPIKEYNFTFSHYDNSNSNYQDNATQGENSYEGYNNDYELPEHHTNQRNFLTITPYDTGSETESYSMHEPGYYGGVTYTTDYNSLLNIEHACSDINGIIVPAYYQFSWFLDVGPCIDGYEEALVIDDTFVPTAENPNPTARGGGVCVVSSCLRNAVEAVVGIENILEAHNHTKDGVPIDMSYASIGHQASLNYSSMDFRFYNPYPYSLRIEASFDWNSQTCYVSVIPE